MLPKKVFKAAVKVPQRVSISESDEGDSDDSLKDESNSTQTISKSEISNKELIKGFENLYTNFDEDDIEVYENLLVILDVLVERKCISADEYTTLKDGLNKKLKLNFYESIESTTENMIRDDKAEIFTLLRGLKKDESAKAILQLVKDYFEGEEELETVLNALSRLENKLEAHKAKMILNMIGKTKNRVNQIFTQLMNGSNKRDILSNLRSENHITDEQYGKLIIGPHTLTSISKIIQGKGLWLSRK